jgi:hypothetical protein
LWVFHGSISSKGACRARVRLSNVQGPITSSGFDQAE